MANDSPIVVRAGVSAARQLRDEGFRPESVGTLVGASGGPKWLVLRALDDLWAERLIRPRNEPLDALGSSIGSFRHACLGQSNPMGALSRFCDAYVERRYEHRQPSMRTISRESAAILDTLLGQHGGKEISQHKMLRNHFVATRLRGRSTSDRGLGYKLRLARAALANAASRSRLGHHFERGVFGPSKSPIEYRDFPTQHHVLAPGDVSDALLASGSIPLVMEGVPHVGGVPGPWSDGGIIDYHFDFGFERAPGLVLFPHFFDRITPGWFDKPLSWRRPARADLDDVVMIAPSESFVASLPGGRVPDRNDFALLKEAERIRRWREVLDRSRAIPDAWAELVDGNGLADAIRPFQN